MSGFNEEKIVGWWIHQLMTEFPRFESSRLCRILATGIATKKVDEHSCSYCLVWIHFPMQRLRVSFIHSFFGPAILRLTWQNTRRKPETFCTILDTTCNPFVEIQNLLAQPSTLVANHGQSSVVWCQPNLFSRAFCISNCRQWCMTAKLSQVLGSKHTGGIQAQPFHLTVTFPASAPGSSCCALRSQPPSLAQFPPRQVKSHSALIVWWFNHWTSLLVLCFKAVTRVSGTPQRGSNINVWNFLLANKACFVLQGKSALAFWMTLLPDLQWKIQRQCPTQIN